MANKRILIIGADGFIGRCLSEKLKNKAGYNLVLLVRKKPKAPIPDSEYLIMNLLDKREVSENITNFDIVINTAAVVRTIKKQRYDENVSMMKNIIFALKKNRIKRIIHISTQNIHLVNKDSYSISKINSERILQNTNLDYLIIRPNYVYSINKDNDIYKLAKLIFYLNIAIVVGSGDKKMQPVLREDLVDIIMNTIEKFPKDNILEISGPETISIMSIISQISSNFNKKPLVIHIPFRFLSWLRFILPVDLHNLVENNISINPVKNHNFSSFKKDLKKICRLVH